MKFTPYKGLRVVDLTDVWAGPMAASFLGDLGIPGLEFGGFAGGVEFLFDRGEPVLLLTVQAISDWVYEVKGRFRYGPSSGGRIGADGDAAYLGNPNVHSVGALTHAYSSPSSLRAATAVFVPPMSMQRTSDMAISCPSMAQMVVDVPLPIDSLTGVNISS